jgi:hypothetical protein
MVQVSLMNGSYESRSAIGSSQRQLNLYSEHIDPTNGEPNQMILLPTPGLTQLALPPAAGRTRGMWKASNGFLFVCIDQAFYYVDKTFAWNLLGTWPTNSNLPVKMADNGVHLIVCDGTTAGYSIPIAAPVAWTALLPAGTGYDVVVAGGTPQLVSGWSGANYLDFTDTYFIANQPGTPLWISSDSEDITFNASNFAGKSAYPDLLQAAIVEKEVVWLIGLYETEIWYNSGGQDLVADEGGITASTTTFPFQIIPSSAIDWGCQAQYSIAKAETTIFWLGQNINGGGIVLAASGQQIKRISTHAVEDQFRKYSVLSDAEAYCYMQEGHSFYVLNFPTADKTWVYDLATETWHERCWFDSSGNEHRHRGAFHASAYGYNIVGDWQNGTLYALDLNNYTDVGAPIKRYRSFPQMLDVQNNNRLYFTTFRAQMDTGQDIIPGNAPEVFLSWSDDGGNSFGNPMGQSLGEMGQFRTNLSWNRLGMARNRVFALEWTSNCKTALAGAFVQYAPGNY